MSNNEELRQHHQKWKNWNEAVQKEKLKQKMNVEEGMEKYATDLIQKMSDKSMKEQHKNNQRISKEISTEIQSNVCSICLELMIPPTHQPMILFPCGHNLCKDCIYDTQPKGHVKEKMTLKINKCMLCRQPITTVALNRSLMTLICTYSNNKELLEKELALEKEHQEEEEQKKNYGDIEKIRVRCKILVDEKNKVKKQQEEYKKQKKILTEVLDTLLGEKKRNQKEQEMLEKEAKLISRHLETKTQEMDLIDRKIKQMGDKDRIVQKALGPLVMEKEKLQYLEIARLIEKNKIDKQ